MAPMQRLSPGVYRGQGGGLVQSKTGVIPRKPKPQQPQAMPERSVQPMPRGGSGQGMGGLGGGKFPAPMPENKVSPMIPDAMQRPNLDKFQPPGMGNDMSSILGKTHLGDPDLGKLQDIFNQMRQRNAALMNAVDGAREVI